LKLRLEAVKEQYYSYSFICICVEKDFISDDHFWTIILNKKKL